MRELPDGWKMDMTVGPNDPIAQITLTVQDSVTFRKSVQVKTDYFGSYLTDDEIRTNIAAAIDEVVNHAFEFQRVLDLWVETYEARVSAPQKPPETGVGGPYSL